jgi:hypothetical protein
MMEKLYREAAKGAKFFYKGKRRKQENNGRFFLA